MLKKGNSRLHFKNIRTGLKSKRSTRDCTRAEHGLFSSKCSQVTIFIIIAVLLVVGVGIVFVVRNSLKSRGENLPVGTENVGDYVTNCLKLTSENGLILIGRQGGYYKFASEPNVAYSGNDSEPGILFTNLGSINVPYYYNLQNIMPSKEKIEEQLSFYVEDNLGKCINDFSVFKQKGFTIDAGNIDVTTTILDEKVRVSLDYLVTITKGETTQTKTAHSAEIPLRLGLVYNISKDFVSLQAPISGRLCLECLSAVVPSGFHVQVLKYNDNTNIFVFTDKERKLNNNNYDFIFAYKY